MLKWKYCETYNFKFSMDILTCLIDKNYLTGLQRILQNLILIVLNNADIQLSMNLLYIKDMLYLLK